MALVIRGLGIRVSENEGNLYQGFEQAILEYGGSMLTILPSNGQK